MPLSFVGLHNHSDYSLLDGASQLPQMVARAAELGMKAIALTDHGVMYGAAQLVKLCQNHNIKPIIGNEMYIMNGDVTKQERRPKYHQVVLAKNMQGYKNLVKLTTISHLEGYQGKGIFARPCINKDLLKEHSEGLIVTSACLGGELPQAILRKRYEVARERAKWYQDVFGDDFYIEIQDHGSQDDRFVNVELVKIARELDIKIIATNDSHFTACNDVEAHDALLCIQTGKKIIEAKRMRYSGTEYLKSADEMAQLFRDHLSDDVIEEAISNTVELADKVEPYKLFGEPRIPDYPIPPNHTADSYLEEVTWNGLLERLKLQSRSEIPNEYKERMESELSIMQSKGFSTYFLVVWDYINFARSQKIPVGPGRGSAAGSLVAYSLKITNIDPVHHGLLFERFLNPERKSMPDIDTDFCIDRREEVIDYVAKKYGSDRVAQIITFNRMTSKAVLKDVARVLDISYGEADKWAKTIPVSRGKPEKLKVMISEETPEPEFHKAYVNNIPLTSKEGINVATFREWLDMAIRIEGTNKTFGVHAAGVVISAQPLDEIVPLQRNNEGWVITQYFMEDLESLGLLKMDFLGLKNLTMIQKTLDLVEKNRGQAIDPDDLAFHERKAQEIVAKTGENRLPEDIQKTYQILADGNLEGIFQLESSGMRQVVRDLKPSCVDDISSILALYRPGPLDAGLIPKFINRKHGKERIEYDREELEPILKETYGVMVYQEQIMRIARELAGYSLGEADLLRRAMGKKKVSEMQKHREKFIDGTAKNGIPKKIATELFTMMEKFAEYCFNKSHSMAYAYVTYQTSYLKANYPVEYMAALLSANSGNQDKVQRYIATCTNMNIDVESPDINRSEVDFTPIGNTILFGLSAVRNLGEGAIDCILAARNEGGEFKSLADLCDRVSLQTVNRKSLEALILCGALDQFNPNRHQHMEDLKYVIDWAQSRAKDRASGQSNIFDFLGSATSEDNGNSNSQNTHETAPSAPPVPDYSSQDKLKWEKEYLGFYVSDHPLKAAQKSSRLLSPISLNDLAEKREGTSISAIVMISEVKQIITKKGDRMAVLQIEDLTGQAEAVVFPKNYAQIGALLEVDARLIVWGKADRRDDREQFIIEDAEPIDRVQMVMVELTPQQAADIHLRDRLRNTLREQVRDDNRSKVPVVARIKAGKHHRFVPFGQQFRVSDCAAAVQALNTEHFTARAEPLLRG